LVAGRLLVLATVAARFAYKIGLRTLLLFCATVPLACGGGGSGDEASAEARLEILSQPADQTVVEGNAAEFTVEAVGADTYRWQAHEGGSWIEIPGATQARYTTPPVQLSDNGRQFRVVVAGAVSTASPLASSSVTLRVTKAPVAPAIVVHPVDLTVVERTAASFFVTAEGTSLTYAWQQSRDGGSEWVPVPGGNASSLLLQEAPLSLGGSLYRVVVTNELGSATSAEARLLVTPPPASPVFAKQPEDAAVIAGEPATLGVTVVGEPRPGLQWQRQGSAGEWLDIPGATAATYATPATVLSEDGSRYRVVATNQAGVAVSSVARLTVHPAPSAPIILVQPEDAVVVAGSPATFSVSAQGVPSTAFQWQVSSDGTAFSNVNGATEAAYTSPSVGTAEDGRRYRVVISNPSGSVVSTPAELRILPRIDTHPQSQGWGLSISVALSVEATGPSLTYQWQRSHDGGHSFVDVAGAVAPSLRVSNSRTDQDDHLRVLVRNRNGEAVSATAVISKNRWRFVNPQPSADELAGVAWATESTAVAVGQLGSILRSTDSGVTWESIAQPDWGGHRLNAVAFSSGGNGVAVGAGPSRMRFTSDGGATWQDAGVPPVGEELTGVSFVNASTVVAVGLGGAVLQSTDAGRSWVRLHIPGVTGQHHFKSVAFNASGVGIAVGAGVAIRTADAGLSWTFVAQDVSVDDVYGSAIPWTSVAFADASTVVAASWSYGTVRSTDAGQTWHRLGDSSFNLTASGNAVAFANSTTGMIVHIGGIAYRTSDGGRSWGSVYVPTGLGTPRLNAVAFNPEGVGLAVGPGRLLRSDNFGLYWVEVSRGNTSYLRDVAFATPEVGVAVDTLGYVLRTSDGGENWTWMERPAMVNSLSAVTFTSAERGFAVGDWQMLRTEDGGLTWSDVTEKIAGGGVQLLADIHFATPLVGFAAGRGEHIMRTSDGGASWVPVSIGPERAVRAVGFASSEVGVAVGAFDSVLRTVDGGLSWASVAVPTTEWLNAVSFADPLNGVAVGNYGTVLRTSDAGATWQLVQAPMPDQNHLLQVVFADGRNGLAVGIGSTVLRTRDAGQTWTPDPVGRPVLSGVAFPTPTKAVLVSSDGVILTAPLD
jgi:photosystem II stability/assembly factor-like uncharacterized protein